MNGASSLLNLPALLVGSLLAASAVTYMLRQWERLTAVVGAAIVCFWAALLWQVDLTQPLWILPLGGQVVDLAAPLERLGFTFRLEPEAIPILVSSLLLAGAAFVLAACLSQGRSFVPFGLALLAGYVSLALLITGPLAPSLLAPLVLAALSALGVFVLQAGRLGSAAGPLRSLIPPLLAFPLFLLAAWYLEQIPLNPQDNRAAITAAQLIALGLVLLLAPVPLHGAQPAIAQSAPPVVSALLLLLYQLAVLHLLYRTVTVFSFVPQAAPLGIWLTWLGLATAVWGGVAAAGANHAGRLWGYTALHDWGLILLVLAVPDVRSWPLVLFLFGLRVVSMLTAATGLSVLEQHTGGMTLEHFQGAGSRLPWNSAALLLGGLGLAGFPLSAGFTGHWAALQIVAETDWRTAAVVLIASGGAIFGYVRLARVLYGPLANRYLLREQPVNVGLAVAVLVLSVGLAVAPQLLDGPISRALLAFSG
jgi:formate hydrogenlyase subunit 3/multisubunit Na+/H+ antiporter MnhD subunit